MRVVLCSVERRKNYSVRIFSKHRVPNKIWGFNFWFSVVADLPVKKEKIVKNKRTKGHFRLLICSLTCAEVRTGPRY